MPLAKIPGFNDEQCQYIQEQHKELLRYARDNNDGKEVAFVFKSDMTRLEPFMGTDDRLNFGTELLGKGNDLTVLHNLPRNGSFSMNDIDFFIDSDAVKTLTIVKKRKVEIIHKSDNYDAKKFVTEYRRLVKKLTSEPTKSEMDNLVRKLLTKNKSGVIWNVR